MALIKIITIAFIAIILSSCSAKKEQVALVYPITKKGDVVDTLFGTAVADPYRWLENDTAKETAAWVTSQNKVTFDYLDSIPFRNDIKRRLEAVYNYERLSAPFKEGDYTYFYKNNGLQNHSVLFRRIGSSEPEIFLDPNSFSKDGTTGLSGVSFTKDGSLVAYLISEGGSDWRKAIVMDTKTKVILEDTLKDLKFTGISWRGKTGFYYSSYDKPKGSDLSAKTQYHKVFYHKLGTSQKTDIMVFGGEETPRRYIGAYLTEDERFLIVTASKSTSGNELYAQDLNDPKGKLVCLVNNFENSHGVIANIANKFIIETNLNAPNTKVVSAIFPNATVNTWQDVIPETENVLNTSTGGGKIFANYMVDVKTQIKQFNLDGKLEATIELPGIGTASGFGAKLTDTELYYSFTSFTYPPTLFKYSIVTGKSDLYEKPKVDFNSDDFETKQVFYLSKDSTKIPMYITYKKGLVLNGKNPTILYGYGGFNISLTPSFSTSRIVWLENGGVYAQANLRGGGEYGEKWHDAGTKLNKQNVFDDFIAAAEYLKSENYTSSEFLALMGGSNGGLLVGATLAQRHDLAKVALPAVGVMDMLRYHKFTAGAGWAYDYGTADDSKEMFDYLRKYSPVHALKSGVNYPATLVTTADHDDRVVPAHSFKFISALQAAHNGTNPVIIRIDVKSGHGSSNLSKSIASQADQYAFIWYNMGVTPALGKK